MTINLSHKSFFYQKGKILLGHSEKKNDFYQNRKCFEEVIDKEKNVTWKQRYCDENRHLLAAFTFTGEFIVTQSACEWIESSFLQISKSHHILAEDYNF